MPTPSRRLQTRAARYGTTNLPVRSNSAITVNGPPDGWVRDQPGGMPWDTAIADNGQPPAWWLGVASGDGPIGPHGPGSHKGYGHAAVTRATSLLVDPLVSDPFIVEEDAYTLAVPTQRLDPPRWILDPHLLRPDDRINPSPPLPLRKARSVFWREWIVQALYWGRGFLYFVEDFDGRPVAGTLRVLDRYAVEIDEWTGCYRINEALFDDDGRLGLGRIVRLDNPLHPEGVFAAHPDVFTLTRKLARYAEGTFHTGVPAGYLKVNAQGLTQKQADDLKAGWLKSHGGDQRSIAVLNATTDFHALSLSPVDAALVEVKRASIADLAFAFGMAPEVLGVTLGNSATYSNIKDWWRLHRDFALSPWVDAVGGTLTALVPQRQTIAVDLDGHSRPDEAERLANYAVGIPLGIYSADEARLAEGRRGPAPTQEVATI